jgi:hypothetical protein
MPNLSQQFLFVINTGTVSTSVSIPSTATANTGPIPSGVFLSLPQKGDGYFGSGDGIHTVTYSVDQNFSGSIYMQGSLATTPTSEDWFNIVNTTATYSQLLSTPINSYANFTGNFVWVRAVVERPTIGQNGVVLVINYNR